MVVRIPLDYHIAGSSGDLAVILDLAAAAFEKLSRPFLEMVHRVYTHLHDEPLKPLDRHVTRVQHSTGKTETKRKIRNREIMENTKGP
jgi:hypothetical protein